MPRQKLSAISYQLSARRYFSFIKSCKLTAKSYESGFSQLALVLLLLAGVAVTTYVVQNRTNLIPHAAEPAATAPSLPGTLVKQEATESINPGAGAEKVGNLTKAKIVSRQQTQASEGYQIHFVWSDGRESWDTKDNQGNLVKSKSYAIRDGKKSKQVSGGTTGGQTVWDDGTIEYNVFVDGKYSIADSYSTCCTSQNTNSNTSNSTTTSNSSSNNSSNSNSSASKTKPLSNQPKNGPDSNNTARSTTANNTANSTAQNQTAASTTSTALASAQSTLTQFQNLQQTFNTTLAPKAASTSAALTADKKAVIDQWVAKTNQSFTTGISQTQSCISAPSTTCANNLAPLLNYALTVVRLTSFAMLFSDIPEVCTRADFGISPPITLTSTDGVTGPLYLCSGSDGKEKKWRIFDNNNTPHTLSAADTAAWPTLNDPATTAEFPQAFQSKFSQANQVVTTQAAGTAP